ncbi:hypothetical protein [uncultured Prevotella sp.]|uniref:hypothetical protein n=1 Tax=uncultured Prevotella sp. TaxID=159272 RepID=UPI002804082E|nr:hypothetical protein [uncultured Prevotella sp.]
MKRFILSIAMMLTVAMSTMAMSYEQARERALFLTDKMAYELNLTDEQYEAAYEVNLDYLMSINSYDDLYGTYWTRRNLDLSYILYDWQYSTFCSAAYFYRPLIWDNGVWRFSIYARYPHRTYFYFGRPAFYVSYCGGHSWHMNGGRSWYHGRTFGPRPGESRFGMRDRFDRGDFRGSRGHGRDYDRRDNGRGYDRRDDRRDNDKGYNRGNGRNDNRGNSNYGGYRGNNNGGTPSRGTGTNTSGQSNRDNNGGYSGSRGKFGNNTELMRQNRRANDFTTRQSSTRETVTRNNTRMERMDRSQPSRSTGSSSFSRSSFNSSRPATTFTPSRSTSNTRSTYNGGSSNRSRGSFSGGGRSGGGGHFGGRR